MIYDDSEYDHELKCWPEFFEAVKNGSKTFEIRKDDRDYCVGQVLLLREFYPNTELYSGETVRVAIKYKTDFKQMPGYTVLGIELPRKDLFELYGDDDPNAPGSFSVEVLIVAVVMTFILAFLIWGSLYE